MAAPILNVDFVFTPQLLNEIEKDQEVIRVEHFFAVLCSAGWIHIRDSPVAKFDAFEQLIKLR